MSNQAPDGRRNVIVGVAIAAVIVLVVGIAWAVQANRDTSGDEGAVPGENTSETPTETSDEPTEATPSESETAEAEVPDPSDEGSHPDFPIALVDTYGLGVGNPEAPVKVEIFEDFQCPHCRDFEGASRDMLADAAAAGQAFVVYRPMAFLNQYSSDAQNALGVVLDSGDGEAALALHDLLFENQPSGTIPSADWYVEQAVAAGADSAEVEKGILNGSFAQWVVNATDDASKRGVTGTPTVFVNGEQVGGSTVEEMANNVESLIAAG